MRYQIQQQRAQGIFHISNGGPTFDYNPNPPFNPDLPPMPFPESGSGSPPYRPGPYASPNGGNVIIHNPYIPNPNNIAIVGNRPSIFTPPDVPKPDIPTAQGPPVFTFNPQSPYQSQPGDYPNTAPLPPPPGSRSFDPSQINPFVRPRPNPADPDNHRMVYRISLHMLHYLLYMK